MRCAKCEAENREGRKFCAKCAAPLSRLCPKCGASNESGEDFCGECAAPLVQPSAIEKPNDARIRVTEPAAENIEGERKTVTALFADIKGSTELERDLDPEDARAIVDPVLQLMIVAVHRYDGYVAQSTGDGIFALFGAPIAHEDHAQRALHAALAMQQALRQHGEKLKSQGRSPVEARIGVNTGEVVMRTIHTGGHAEYTPVGHVTNLAARMQTVAPIGGIAVSEDTRRLVEGYFELRALGPTPIKGVVQPVNVFEVLGAAPLRGHFELAARRGLTKFVGREDELQQMRRALQLAMSGHGQLIVVVGEAGTGKSRLFHEFKATLLAECKLVEAYSVSHGKASAWLPILELLRGYFAIQDSDDPTSRREKVRAVLTALDPALSDTVPYLFGLLGIQERPDPLAQMDPQIRHRRTLESIKRIILRESLEHPLVVIFEDLHWIDDHTQAMLDLLADSVANARLLLLVNYRPEYRHTWGNKSYYSQLRLMSLDQEGSTAMLTALLGETVELNPLKRMIVERTEGNPFFIEEIVQALFDEGVLARDGSVKMTRSLGQLRLPPTVQGLLASRIDRLPAAHKDLLQTLAVLGRESPLGLIKNVTSLAEGELERVLSNLQASEFIYEQPALADAEYVFKHALTQEVAYNSLLLERRKLLHERAGQALESVFAEQLDDHIEELARHYGRSDNVGKAVEYLGRAGQRALQRCAYADAVSNLGVALNLLQRLPDGPERTQRELLLQLAVVSALMVAKGRVAPEVEHAITRARELCERLGDPPELFAVVSNMWAVQLMRGELRKAYELAEQLLHRARHSSDRTLLMVAEYPLVTTMFWMGEFLSAREHIETAISLDDPKRDRLLGRGFDTGVECMSYGAWTLWQLGYPDQAINRDDEALALAQKVAHPYSFARAQWFSGLLRQYRREALAAQEKANVAMAFSVERGAREFSAYLTSLHGWATAEQGRKEEGIAEMVQALSTLRAAGVKLMRPSDLCRLAAAYMETGRLDDGLSALNEALATTDEDENRHYEAETYRLKGELLLRRDNSAAAEAQACFRRAVEIARNQSAKSWELRATTSLTRLLAKQGRRDEARAMLAEIYNWFTEGFDTRDLKDAKMLLEELDS